MSFSFNFFHPCWRIHASSLSPICSRIRNPLFILLISLITLVGSAQEPGDAVTVPAPEIPAKPMVVNGIESSGLGFSNLVENTAAGAQLTVIKDGPNAGYGYYASPLTYSTSTYEYEINPDLESSTSSFYLHQCGDYPTNPFGFISGANLQFQTRRHEYVGLRQSHYAFYKKSLQTNDPVSYFETRIATPDNTSTTSAQTIFNTATAQEIQQRLDNLKRDTFVEPTGVNQDEDGTPLGRINYGPNYVECSTAN